MKTWLPAVCLLSLIAGCAIGQELDSVHQHGATGPGEDPTDDASSVPQPTVPGDEAPTSPESPTMDSGEAALPDASVDTSVPDAAKAPPASPPADASVGVDSSPPPPVDSGAHDTGKLLADSSAFDTGKSWVADTGTKHFHEDTGTAAVDTGTVVVDTGTLIVDTGTLVDDTGALDMDSGLPDATIDDTASTDDSSFVDAAAAD
ncbi:MAG: hypothetical protein ACXVEE_26790 [Polyangiales bacterium]